MRASGKSNSVELEFTGDAEHLTVMLVVSAGGRPWAPFVIISGFLYRSRKRPDEKYETFHDYLPSGTFLTRRTQEIMTKEIFCQLV